MVPAPEEAPLSEMNRYCPDCGQRTTFEQPHADAGSCPDSPDGQCPEWCCTECGAAVLSGFVPVGGAPTADLWRRVA
jgi:hypothetical protein